MLERTERISFRISSVLSKVASEPELHTGSGSDHKVPAPQHYWLVFFFTFLKHIYDLTWP